MYLDISLGNDSQPSQDNNNEGQGMVDWQGDQFARQNVLKCFW